ncbi:hypothetical protein CIG75_09845 [Tumebacillus algifaecis]|uniref:HMA domain-containing protein n=1 Tax=Tumebacillus algifaecis TaxID=1214604 RepID=A0A223D1P4_9BACL|nr:heavy metal-associated domain-containing protein [Tumebacillus algifaecis]ASS75256.1 hypothetical protein CIG75_09845 [Tumebacillus algifaecis]
MAIHKLFVKGMSHPGDCEKIGHALRQVFGIQEVTINYHDAEVTVSYDERAASLHDFQQAIDDCGFQATAE